MSTFHVVPVNDLIEHDTTGEQDCVCGPDVEPVERDDGSVAWLISHHSLDGRELHRGSSVISDEKRASLTDLALRTLDTIEEEYGENAELGDAVIVFDVLVPDSPPTNHGNYLSTTERSVVASGLLRMAELYMSRSDPPDEDE